MHLKAEVTAPDGVEEVEADGEILSEPGLDDLSEHLAAAQKNQVLGRQLETHTFDLKQEAVLLRNAVETPAIVGNALVQVADFLHPLSSPDSRIKIRDEPEGLSCDLIKPHAQGSTGDHLRISRLIGIQEIIDPVENLRLPLVRDPPLDKIAALYLAQRILMEILLFKVRHPPPHTELNFPAGKVAVDELSHVEGDVHLRGSIVAGRESSCSGWCGVEHRPLGLHHLQSVFLSLLEHSLTHILQVAVGGECPIAVSGHHLVECSQVANVGRGV